MIKDQIARTLLNKAKREIKQDISYNQTDIYSLAVTQNTLVTRVETLEGKLSILEAKIKLLESRILKLEQNK